MVLRIATFNLESLDEAGDDGAPLAARCEILRPQLVRLEADILCLQEVNGQHQRGARLRTFRALEALLEGTEYAGFDRASTRSLAGEGPADVHNLVTLSRHPIVEHTDIRNSTLPPMKYKVVSGCPPVVDPVEVGFDRPVLLTTVRLEGGALLSVINLHLRAPLAAPITGQKEGPFVWKSVSGWAEGYFLSSLKRSAQALETRMIIDRLLDSDPHRLIAVTGDFNAEDHETPLRILSGSEEDTGNGLLAHRALAVLDRSISDDRRFSVLHHGRPVMLDHILASRALFAHFRTIEVHNEMLGDETVGFGKTHHRTGSYHAPVVASFSLA